MGSIVKPLVSETKEKKENTVLELCKKLLVSLIIALIVAAPLSFIAWRTPVVGGINSGNYLIFALFPTIVLVYTALAVLSYLASLKLGDKARHLASYALWAGVILIISVVMAQLFLNMLEPPYPTDVSFECLDLTTRIVNTRYHLVGTGILTNFEDEAMVVCGNVSVIDENGAIIGQQASCCGGEPVPPQGTGKCAIDVDLGPSNKTYKSVQCEKSAVWSVTMH